MEDQLRKSITFAPMMYFKNLSAAIDYYKQAFDATVLWSIPHNGNVHVAELRIANGLLRMHEESDDKKELSPSSLKGTSVVIGLFTDDPDAIAAKAVAAGGAEISPVQDYEYGYRQGTIRDPFGHHWLLEKNAGKPPILP